MWMLVLVLAAFHLMRIDGTWKITGGSFTVERTGCAPSPRATAPTTDGHARRTTKHLGTTTLSSTPLLT